MLRNREGRWALWGGKVEEEGGKGIALLVEATPFWGEERNAGWGIERIRPRKPPLRLGRDCLRRNHWGENRSEPTDDSREDSHHFRSTAMIETSVSDWGGTLNNRAKTVLALRDIKLKAAVFLFFSFGVVETCKQGDDFWCIIEI
jgi:hypothetical protein